MIHRHTLEAVSGHWGWPQATGTGKLKESSPFPHMSTVRGYVESIMGLPRGGFVGEVALGILRPAGGHGYVLKQGTGLGSNRNHLFAADGSMLKNWNKEPKEAASEEEAAPDGDAGDVAEEEGEPKKKKEPPKEFPVLPAKRPWPWEVWFDITYQIGVRAEASVVERLGAALRGEGHRYGVLSFGTSDDEVHTIRIESVPAQWVVPGNSFPLIVCSKTGFGERFPEVGRFSLSSVSKDIPEEAWVRMGVPKKRVRSGRL